MGGSDFRTREVYKGVFGRIEIKKGNQGTWKRVPKEKQQGVVMLVDICKENLQSSGQKRVRGHNEGGGSSRGRKVQYNIASVRKFS